VIQNSGAENAVEPTDISRQTANIRLAKSAVRKADSLSGEFCFGEVSVADFHADCCSTAASELDGEQAFKARQV
jgi:hypothetical protein